MSKQFTLKDLKEIDLDKKKGEVRYAFPNSPMTYNKEDAEKVLIIANYIGILTDSLRSEIMVNLITELKAIKAHIGME